MSPGLWYSAVMLVAARRVGFLLPGLLVAAAALAGCSKDALTQLVVVVDTDMDVPSELDAIRIEVRNGLDELQQANGSLTGADATTLPVFLSLVHSGGPLGPVEVRAVGLRRGADIVERRASVFFVEGQTRVLRLNLLASCVDVMCSAEQTCAEMGCRTVDIAPTELGTWTGTVERDGGPPEDTGPPRDVGPECSTEVCNGVDDDCDGDIDEGFDLQTDLAHCGACDNACPATPADATSTCSTGSCGLTCDAGFDDCDGDATNGCEAPLTAPDTCGDCTTQCSGTTPLCEVSGGGASCVRRCTGGTTRCGTSCVDTDTDVLHCGACDSPCPDPAQATATCSGGTCGMSCDSGFDDCDGRSDTGCETSLRTTTDCGMCGRACAPANATGNCSSGSCAIGMCNAGFGDCTGGAGNGCETSLGTDTNCARCGDRCTPGGSCVGGACLPSCDSLYSSAPSYRLCAETMTACEFYTVLGGSSCAAVCSARGGTCSSTYANGADSCTRASGARSCTATHNDEICVCSRGP